MGDVQVTFDGFTGGYSSLNGESTLSISALDIARAVVTVGAQESSHLTAFGQHSLMKNAGLALMTLCVLETTGSALTRNELYNSLDRSEKALFSYWLGMGGAKLVAERLMDIAWLAHADPLIRSGTASLGSGRRVRGDLLGRDVSDRWHVFEAKGRSSTVELDLVAKAKYQAQNIVNIQGTQPATYCVSLLRLTADMISIEVDDPPIDGDVSLKILSEEFFKQYYHTIITFLRENGAKAVRRYGIGFQLAPLLTIGNTSLAIGLPTQIVKEPASALEFASEGITSVGYETLSGSLGKDGILIEGHFRVRSEQ